LAAVADAAADINRYPDMIAADLLDALAAHHGINPAQVVAGNGSVAVLGHVLTAFVAPGDEVIYPWRSFEAYPMLVALAGGTAVPVALAPGGRVDLEGLAAAITPRTRIIMVCSPNNPTGPAVHREELAAFLAGVPGDILIALDEAYIQYVTDPSAGFYEDVADSHPNVISLRTFSKAYGLAGLRVGYAIGRSRIIGAVRKAATPFGVNAAAQLAATVSLGLAGSMRERVDAVIAGRDRLVVGLREQGWDVPAAQGNFVWLPAGADSVPLAQAAGAAGVLVRPFDGDGVRVSVGEPEALATLLEVTRSWV
jgi:histidinol-phosphate aminotransferase